MRKAPAHESAELRRIHQEIRAARGLRQLATLRRRYPRVAAVWLESGFALDRLGREQQAIPFYEQALRLGLDGPLLRDALRRFQQARRRFPNDVVVELFLALGYHDMRRETDALRLTALACLRESVNSGLAPFRDVLRRKFRSLGEKGNLGSRNAL